MTAARRAELSGFPKEEEFAWPMLRAVNDVCWVKSLLRMCPPSVGASLSRPALAAARPTIGSIAPAIPHIVSPPCRAACAGPAGTSMRGQSRYHPLQPPPRHSSFQVRCGAREDRSRSSSCCE